MKAVGRTGWVLLSWITLGATTSALCAANGISENLTVRTADGTTLRFTSSAGLTGLRVDDRPLLPADRRGFSPLSICDVTTGERFVPVKAGQADVIDGTLACRADVADLALQAAMRCQADRERITVRVSVRDTSGKDRGLLVRFALPIRAHGWRWWDDLERSRVIGKSGVYENSRRIREFAALPEWKDKPALNMAAHAVNFCNVIAGPVGLCFAVPLDQPRIFRAGYDADRQLFYIVYDVALAKETDPPGTAEFTFYLYRCDPAWGLRSALDRYYRLFPQFFTKHVRREGMWMAFSKLSEIDNVNEFRFAFQEGAPEPGYDDRLGVYSLTYFTHAGLFANIAGYNPETDPEPSYDRQLAAVREKFRKTTGRADLFDTCGLHDARGRLAVKRASVYGHVLAQYNLDPDLPYGQYMLGRIPSVFQSYREWRGGELDGFYYDGITTGVNYRREHFSYANFPPAWDPVHKKPFLYNFFSSVEFARETARRLHAQGKITMMNGAMGSSFYIAPYLDVMGSETGLRIRRSDFCYLRSICRHKPFVTLLKGNFSQLTAGEIERYMRRCVAYGVFPGMFDWPPSGLGPGSRYWDHAEWYERDRLNHRKYQALCQQLASAGWEPLTLARSRLPGLTLERFGRPENGEVFFTVFNDGSETVDTVVAIDPQALPPAAVVVDEISRRWLPGTPASDGRLQVPVRLEPDGLAVLHVASKQQLARSHVRQIQRNLSLRRQMREIDRDRPERLVHWRGTRYGSYDRGRLAGRSCLKLASHSAGSIRGATQWVMLYQQRPEPLRLRMRLRCDGVRLGQSGRLFVDTWLCHVNMKTRFTERKRRQFQLPTGTYEFRDVEFTIEPDRPLRSIQLFLYLWRCEGSVWVDRVSITPVDDAKCEFVVDPEFDQWYDRLPADQQRKVDARFAALEAAVEELKTADIDRFASKALAVLKNACEQEAWINASGLANPCRRESRELRDLIDRLSLACSLGMGIRGLEIAAPSVVVPGETVPVKVQVDGADPSKVTAALRVPEGWQCQRRSHVEFAVTAPKGGVGKTAHLIASARVEAVSGLALPLQRTADLRIVPALEANLRLTDISGDGRRFRFFVELSNHSSTASDVSIQPELPPGWRFLPDPAGTGERRLSPRSAEKRTLTVVAGQSTQPGQYPIGVRVVSAKLDSPLELRQSLFFVPGSRNRLVNPGFESGRTGWAKNERDFTIDRSQSHSGQNSLKLSNGSASLRCGASQTIVLNQKTPRPVFVRGFAKAEEVSGVRDRGFSIYVDIYHTDGTPSYGHAITFQTSTTDWQYGELLIHPKKPIRNVNVYLLLRGHRGTVWFDDILAAELPARDGGRAGSKAKGQ